MVFRDGLMRIRRTSRAAAIALTAASLCACTGVVGLAHGDPGREAPAPPAVQPPGTSPPPATAAVVDTRAISAVTVTFGERAQQAAASDARLTPDEVATAVERELQAQQMYEPASADVRRSLAIIIEDFTNSLASNTSVLGFSFHNVVLVASVQAQGSGMVGQPPFEVRARARITTREGGATAGSLADLYRQFAELTVANLRGLAPPLQPQPR